MVKGSCICGETAYDFDGAALQAKFACHCKPCRKAGGVPASYNLIVPSSAFQLTKGKPKNYTRRGDSGKGVTYNNCPTCSACLWVEAEAMKGTKIIKMGAVDDDDFLNGLGEPAAEIYCRNMWKWEKRVEGADKKQGAE